MPCFPPVCLPRRDLSGCVLLEATVFTQNEGYGLPVQSALTTCKGRKDVKGYRILGGQKTEEHTELAFEFT